MCITSNRQTELRICYNFGMNSDFLILTTIAFLLGNMTGYMVRGVLQGSEKITWTQTVSIAVVAIYFVFLYGEFAVIQYRVPYPLHFIGALAFGHVIGQKVNEIMPWKK